MGKIKFISILVVLLCLTLYSSADGGVVAKAKQYVYEPNQKAVIIWDGGKEKLILSAEIKPVKLSDMAWIIPMESRLKPEVEESDIGVFLEFAQYLRYEETLFGDGVQRNPKVFVIEEKEVDIYDVTIIQASDVESLMSWLREGSYIVPDGAQDIFGNYCGEKGYFIIQKIDLRNLYKDEIQEINKIEGKDIFDEPIDNKLIDKVCSRSSDEFCSRLKDLEQGIATPIMITFWPDKPTYPLRISSINRGETKIELYLIAEDEMIDVNGILTEQAVKHLYGLNETLSKKLGVNENHSLTFFTYRGELSELEGDAVFAECEKCHGRGYLSDDMYWEIYEFTPHFAMFLGCLYCQIIQFLLYVISIISVVGGILYFALTKKELSLYKKVSLFFRFYLIIFFSIFAIIFFFHTFFTLISQPSMPLEMYPGAFVDLLLYFTNFFIDSIIGGCSFACYPF